MDRSTQLLLWSLSFSIIQVCAFAFGKDWGSIILFWWLIIAQLIVGLKLHYALRSTRGSFLSYILWLTITAIPIVLVYILH